MLLIEIDFSSDEAIYQQLCNQIIMGIATSQILEGEVLPSVRQLSDEIGINMHTVNKAYTLLKQEGYVKVDRRKGAFVSLREDKRLALELVEKDLRGVLAEAKCRNVSRNEIHEMVDRIYSEYEYTHGINMS